MTESKQQQIFETWLSRHKALLFKVVRAYASHESDMDDLFQEISIQVWQSIPAFRGDSAVTTWLYRISLNTALKWSQKQRKHRDGHSSINLENSVLTQESENMDPRLDWLYSEISKLNEVDRSLTLLFLDGFSYKEMSAILGISESNIGVKIHRIKQHLIKQSENRSKHGI